MKSSIRLEVMVETPELKKQIVESINLFRYVCRQMFAAIIMSGVAGGEICMNKNGYLTMKPRKSLAIKILEIAFGGKSSGVPNYQMRDFVRKDLAPTWMSYVWDSARITVSQRLSAKDPEFTNASREWLTLQGSRGMARLNNLGIGCALLSSSYKLIDRTICVKWDSKIGMVKFNLIHMKGNMHAIFARLRDKEEGWTTGTIYITERLTEEGRKLYINMSYERPDKVAKLDKRKVLEVCVNPGRPEEYITADCPDERFYAEKISALDAINFLEKIEMNKRRYEKQADASKFAKIWVRNVKEKSHRLTMKRADGQQTFNHLWTRRIVNHAIRTGCGVISLRLPEKSELEGYSWGWYQFKSMLTYKMEELTGKIR